MSLQHTLFNEGTASDPKVAAMLHPEATSGTFVDNMRLPVHRWFRYSAGFSAAWAEDEIRRRIRPGLVVLDPFAGSGTTLLAAEAAGAASVGFESHPFVFRIARAKALRNVDV